MKINRAEKIVIHHTLYLNQQMELLNNFIGSEICQIMFFIIKIILRVWAVNDSQKQQKGITRKANFFNTKNFKSITSCKN